LGFAFAGEELLHQPFFVGFEGFYFAPLCGDQFVQGTKAISDFLLFSWLGRWNFNTKETLFTYIQQSVAAGAACDVLLELLAVQVLLEAVLKENI